MKELDLIGVQMDLGASKRGVAMGPMAIRYGGLREGLEALGFAVHDRGDIVPPEEGESRPNLRYYDQVVDVNSRLYEAVRDSLQRGIFPSVWAVTTVLPPEASPPRQSIMLKKAASA